VSYGIKFINQQQYDGIAVKTVTSTYPQVMWINMSYPNIEMVIYPVPLRLLEWHFISVERLNQPATLATAILSRQVICERSAIIWLANWLLSLESEPSRYCQSHCYV